MPITNGQNADAGDFINESERNATPANDAGKVPKLENDGLLHRTFCRLPITREYQVADSPATWTKPSGLVRVLVQAWGGGGSGAANDATYSASGGGGGAYAEAWIEAADLGATETVTIGEGGAAVSTDNAGNNGGNTTFGSLLTALGGSGGSTSSTANGADIGNGSTVFRGDTNNLDGRFWGGGASRTGSSGSDRAGDAQWGGAGGGPNAFGGSTGGTSIYGGNGGDGNSSGDGADGDEKGGGGGATWNTGSLSGKGGDGFVRVIEFY